jgi:hypothetical protein
MRADLTRDTFDPREHFTRVLIQQGKVELDANRNEQVSILWHYLQTLAADLIGPHGGPEVDSGFQIALEPGDSNTPADLSISPGRYYVDGILCENEAVDREGNEVKVTYRTQPDYPLPDEDSQLPAERPLLAYLHVWERHITSVENPRIREVALNGPDTATRAKVVWQVKTTNEVPEGFDSDDPCGSVEATWHRWVEKQRPTNRGKLKAKAKEDSDKGTDPCSIPPESQFRRLENQLYRVEIHRGGEAWDGSEQDRTTAATFKWSRDNACVTFPIDKLEGQAVTVKHLGRDSRLSLETGNRVEIEDDDYILRGLAAPLLQVEAVDSLNMQVKLSKSPDSGVGGDLAKHPLLRRWDHRPGNPKKGEWDQETDTLLVKEDTWLELEDGVQVFFSSTMPYTVQNGENLADLAGTFGTTVEKLRQLNKLPVGSDVSSGQTIKVPANNTYCTGDYWMIPARTVTGDVEWPGDVDQPEARPPHGIEHHYAPLAVVVSTGANEDEPVDVRWRFSLTRECATPPQPPPP